MASTYTDILRLELPTVGELDATWGTRVNVGITALLETAIAGTAAVTHSNAADYTLTTASGSADEARAMFLNVTGTLTAARNLVCPTKSKLYFVRNATTGGYAFTVKTTGGTGISVPSGKYMMLYCDGTNVVEAVNYSSSFQPLDTQLTDVAGLSPTDNGVIIGNGTNFVVESGATLKTSLGLTIGEDVQAYDADLTTWAGVTPGANVATFLATPTLANLNTAVSDADLAILGANTFTAAQTLPAAGAILTGTSSGSTTLTAGAAASGTAVLPAAGGTLATTAQLYAGGLQTCWIPAGAMTARTTNGAAPSTAEMSTNKNMFKTLDFDAATSEYAQFTIQMPKSWDEGTVTAAFCWSHAATTTNFGVAFALQGVAVSNDDAGDVAFGTAVLAVDTGGTTNDIYVSPATTAITIAGTPAANDYVMVQVYRAVSDAGDTMAIDARLHGIQLFYSTDAATDS